MQVIQDTDTSFFERTSCFIFRPENPKINPIKMKKVTFENESSPLFH